MSMGTRLISKLKFSYYIFCEQSLNETLLSLLFQRNYLQLPFLCFHFQGSTLEKKPWGQLAPKFLDLVASANFLVAKTFRPFGPKTFT